MTQEDKQLLLKDLCARLPYGVMVNYGGYEGCDYKLTLTTLQDFPTEDLKPYLRPMSSMTDEEQKEYHKTFRAEVYGRGYVYVESIRSFDWLDKHNFDYRGLISLGLALEAPEGMYNN